MARTILRGSIYWADLNPTQGREQYLFLCYDAEVHEVRGSRGADSVVARRNSYAPPVVLFILEWGRRGLSDLTSLFLSCLNRWGIRALPGRGGCQPLLNESYSAPVETSSGSLVWANFSLS